MQIDYNSDILVSLVKKYKTFYNDFFKIEKNQQLLENNNFEELFELWPNTCASLCALFIYSHIPFLNHIRMLPNECFYGLPIVSIEIPQNIKGIMSGEHSGLSYGNTPGTNMFKKCNLLKHIMFNKTETEVFNMFDVTDEDELIRKLFGSDVGVGITYTR